ncbi:MAG: hypothetical protein R6U27_16500, partial [Desulfobacterales bacterium]
MLKNCPACNAKYNEKPFCYRCGLNLAKLADILVQADILVLPARIAYLENNYQEMLFRARRAVSLRRRPESLKLMACAALL